MRAARTFLFLAVCLLLVGCGDPYAGGVFGGETTGDSLLFNCYQLGYLREGKDQREPHVAVFWIAHMAGSGTGFGSFAGHTTVGIHGHEISVPDEGKAAFVLRPDYALGRLPLTEDEVVHLFHVVETEGLMLYTDPLWQEHVVPHLRVVEWPEWLAEQE